MALFEQLMVPRKGRLLVEDASGISMSVFYDLGNFAHPDFQAGFLNSEFMKSRGIDIDVVETDEQELEITFTCHATDFADATEKTVPDMVMRTGAWSAGVSTLGANRPWMVKLTYTQEQTTYGAGADSVLVFAKVRPLYAYAEEGTGKFTLKFRVFNPSSTVTRS